MKALVQRVTEARVEVDDEVVGAIEKGFLVLLGVRRGDTREAADWLARKVAHLRVFPDEEGRMNRSLLDAGGEALVVSQFTLYADTRKGHRPSFVQSAPGKEAEPLYEHFCEALSGHLGRRVATGRFGAMMQVHLVNDGPVTLELEKEM